MDEAYFVSDVHLTDLESSRTRAFLKFLKELNQKKADNNIRLFFVGDIFDLWISDYTYFQNKFAPIIHEIKEFIKTGNELYYFEGNHDLYLKDFWQKEIGATVVADFEYYEINGIKVRVEHGDLADPEDKGYRFLRAFLRNLIVRFILSRLPEGFLVKLGEMSSRSSRKYTSEVKVVSDDDGKNKIIAYADKCYDHRPFDLMVTGHTHIFDDAKTKNYRSINLGSWFDTPKYLQISSNTTEIVIMELA
ncbi:MAG: UDP-2,3-diacylglucosamine diphosphatase [Bdellovibrionaceae bacterium]|jgi:UDP-2,3-diacylglucosamine hydrolase|nr:UDP-2,3-diacylglucosamine diphosphatase [Pseudobdellovibrionaceae bacterium]